MKQLSSSLEFTVDAAMEDIVAKIAAGTASPKERAELAKLGSRRVRMMRRPLVKAGRRVAA